MLEDTKVKPSELLANEGSKQNALNAEDTPKLVEDKDPKEEETAREGANTLVEDNIGLKLINAEPTLEENRNKKPGAPNEDIIEIK